LGRNQADALATELQGAITRGTTVEAVYSSPLRAAMETADAIARDLEIDAPRIASELTTLTPEVLPSGDNAALEALQERAWALIEALKQEHDERSTIVLVSHELTIRAVVCRALSMALDDAYRFALDPASLTTIEFRLPGQRERILIANLNETCHLE
ncbi:MAG TPA: histidine phosphatase family protein, partial [Dehalococcoidia bacterium]|nr:histidine phosphatase family protein [Dehalococcoidia bacterium]